MPSPTTLCITVPSRGLKKQNRHTKTWVHWPVFVWTIKMISQTHHNNYFCVLRGHTLQCHSQGWRLWPAIEPKSSLRRRPAPQRWAGLELNTTAAWGKKISKHLIISHKIRKKNILYFINCESALTSRAHSISVFIFSTEDSHLHHPQEYDTGYPELDPQ